MKPGILVIAGLFVLLSCGSNKQITFSSKLSEETVDYLAGLKSKEVKTDSLELLFDIGRLNVYYGNDQLGNEIMHTALGCKEELSGDDYHNISVQNTKNGNYEYALPYIKRAVAIDPENQLSYAGWLVLYYYREYELAIDYLNRYDDLTPDFNDAPMAEGIHYLKGLAQMQLENYDSAIQEFDKNIDNDRKSFGEDWINPYALVNKGRCQAAQERYEEAIATYLKAIHVNDSCAEAYFFQGIAELEINKKDAARKNLNKSLNLVQAGLKDTDIYVELFHEIYEEQIQDVIKKNFTK